MRISDWSSDVCSSDLWCAVAVLDVGGVDYGMNEIAVGIGEDVALASLGLLARVVAARSAAFRGFHALAVDHAGTRTCLAACRFASGDRKSTRLNSTH